MMKYQVQKANWPDLLICMQVRGEEYLSRSEIRYFRPKSAQRSSQDGQKETLSSDLKIQKLRQIGYLPYLLAQSNQEKEKKEKKKTRKARRKKGNKHLSKSLSHEESEGVMRDDGVH